MGLIYIPSDANQVESQLTKNLEMSRALLNRLKSATTHLTTVVGGGKLDGKAYKKGLGLMQDCVLPTIQHATSAIDGIAQDLAAFTSAKSYMPREPLYEEKLTAQIAELRAQKAAQDALSAVYQHHILSLVAGPIGVAIDLAISQFTDAKQQLDNWGNSIDEEIRKIEEKLDKLRQFNAQTSHLFQDSLAKLKLAMQGVEALNGSKINSDGSYRLASGMDKSWFSKMQKTTSTNAYLELYKQVEELLKPLKSGKNNNNIKRLEMLLKAYPANVVKKLLGNDEVWMLLNKLSPSVQTKFINALAKYEWFGQAVAQGKWLPKIDTLGKAYETFNKLTSPIKTVVSEGLKNSKVVKGLQNLGVAKGLGKVASVATYAQLGITFVSSGINEYGKTGSIGKGAIGGAIETVKGIGPLEGMTLGSTIGGMIGTAIPVPILGTISGAVAGAVIGGISGLINVGVQLVWPDAYDNAKKWAYNKYDESVKAVKDIGKGIGQGVNTVKHVFNDIGNTGKSIGKAISGIKLPEIKLGW